MFDEWTGSKHYCVNFTWLAQTASIKYKYKKYLLNWSKNLVRTLTANCTWEIGNWLDFQVFLECSNFWFSRKLAEKLKLIDNLLDADQMKSVFTETIKLSIILDFSTKFPEKCSTWTPLVSIDKQVPDFCSSPSPSLKSKPKSQVQVKFWLGLEIKKNQFQVQRLAYIWWWVCDAGCKIKGDQLEVPWGASTAVTTASWQDLVHLGRILSYDWNWGGGGGTWSMQQK